jgi:hypothetical protein
MAARTHESGPANAVSPLRLYLLRVLYIGNFLFVGFNAFSALLTSDKPIPPVTGVAFAFWAALGLMSGVGIRYPLKMLPVLFMQLCYKTIWLLTIALPIWKSGQWSVNAPSLFRMMIAGAIIDLIVIPWPYVVRHFVRAAGTSWTFGRARADAVPSGVAP